MHFVKLISKKLYKPNSMLSFVQRSCNSSKKSIPAGSQFFTLLTKTPRQSKQIQFYSLWGIRSAVLGLINVTESLELQFIQTSCHLWRILIYKLKSAGRKSQQIKRYYGTLKMNSLLHSVLNWCGVFYRHTIIFQLCYNWEQYIWNKINYTC